MTKDPKELLEKIERLEKENEELRRLLSEEESANQAKEAFLSNMSHDIRTPMNAIIGLTALAKKHIDEKSRVQDALNKMEIAGGHLLSLINDVLDMSRINSGRLRISESLFSLGDLLHETMTIVKPQAQKKDQQLVLETEGIEWEDLIGDALRLRQIYVNIINNAVKYTPEEGKIRVAVKETLHGDRVMVDLICEDNGIGMSEDFLTKIFDPFERVSSSTLSGIEGTGLGMSIVKKLVDTMGGTIQIKSKEGVGTTVRVAVPLRYESISLNMAPLAEERFLILEDKEELRNQYKAILRGIGTAVVFADNSSEAVSLVTEKEVQGEPFTVCILGHTKENQETVFELASYLKNREAKLLLVLVSEVNWDSVQYRAERAGIGAFIPVPFFKKSLVSGLLKALEKPEEGGSLGGIPDLTGQHVLLAEDNMINREIALEILSATGAVVDACENGQEAVEKYQASPVGYYRVILMDIQMPVLDGYGATKMIRGLEREDAPKVKIYAMTANAFAEDIQKAKDSGMDGHIAKPIDIQVLMKTLSQFA